ncbi:MAG: hypothetical protein NTU98_00895 [Bacteroidetes bacterium]|nr:hypothetical protein [Bacteroidota bacterium]
MKSKILTVLTVALLLGSSSCIKRNTTTVNDYNHRNYFSARFENYFSPGETGIMIFLSDQNGNLLSEEWINGQTSVTLYPQQGTLFPTTLTETLVYTSPGEGGKTMVHLYSYLQVMPDSWIWKTFESATTGSAILTFGNVPPHTAYSISSYSGWNHGDALSSAASIYLGKDPDNIYLLLNTTAQGYRYKWLTGIEPSAQQWVDLSSMETPISKVIPIPGTLNLNYQLNGYLPSGEHAKGYYTVDYGGETGTYTDSVVLHFPATIFNDFEFNINTIDPSDSHKQWYQYTFGTIPNSVSYLNGDVSVLNSAPDNFHVQVSGSFDRLGSSWEANPIGPYRYQWTVYGAPTATTFKFPALPDDLVKIYAGFIADSLKLSSVEIKDFSQVSSYYDLIRKMFVSGNYIANIVPGYSGLIRYMPAAKKADKPGTGKGM